MTKYRIQRAKDKINNTRNKVSDFFKNLKEIPDFFRPIFAAVGLTSIAIANIAATLTHIDEIRQFLYKMFGFNFLQTAHIFVIAVIVLTLLLGYGSLCYILYLKFLKNSSQYYKYAYLGGSCILISSLIYLGTYSRPVEIESLLAREAKDFSDGIFAQQIDSDTAGGMRYSKTGASNDTQVWTTAQCLVAVFVASSPDEIATHKDSIRNAFAYIERKRKQNGWGYTDQADFSVTDVNAWVTLAYIFSLQHSNLDIELWQPEEIPTILQRIHRELDEIAARKHQNGGWGPILKTDSDRHVRTYSTIMSLWALIEARRNPLVYPSVATSNHDQAIRDGVTWLLNHIQTNHDDVSGWWPNPNSVPRPGDDFPGLTAQTLFVLERVLSIRTFSPLRADGKFREQVDKFLKHMADENRKIPVNQTDVDQLLEGRSEMTLGMTFLWYPWMIVLTESLSTDNVAASGAASRARDVLNRLLSRSNEFTNFIKQEPDIYPTAEGLFAFGIYLRSHPAKTQR